MPTAYLLIDSLLGGRCFPPEVEVRRAWIKAKRQSQHMDHLEVLSRKVFLFNMEIPEADQIH